MIQMEDLDPIIVMLTLDIRIFKIISIKCLGMENGLIKMQ